ncbi:MAG: hypothetical protein A2W90_04780 [Bacteroidetes bacterium GWF2_42_66]|nr:MAG: hypothetical protein A2W89_21000 [Bacteroidetes bacterium GWE2_42_39]OFY40804.1 MAG: hypothetical protein A2W90_04780 [Bacteroidetes bacterium GWF2_42_66]HBL75820.1 phosphatase [Prolixibacteraceae bacterium]HCU63069.1 phosphatase [Prolixibacteraceae bacterium]
MNRIAVIDLGTNTCNLLIAEYGKHNYNLLYQGKEVVKMGRGGIHKNLIREDGIRRAVHAILKHQEKITKYRAGKTIAIATSAVRDANNRGEFCNTIFTETGISLQVISGEKEAELIFKGVLLAFDDEPGNSLILDIGGGSNEFILCRRKQIIWKESFPLGVARIIERFPPSDPITKTEIETIRNYFDENMNSLWTAVSGKKPDRLIGCSGAFDTLVDLLDETEPGTKLRKQQEICPDDFQKIYERLIHSTTEERMQMKGLEQLRQEMIVPAIILIDLVVKKAGIPKIVQTDYALREGVLHECIRTL